VRFAFYVLAAGMGVFYLAALVAGRAPWLVWMDTVVAVISVVIAGTLPRGAVRRGVVRALIPAFALYLLWGIGLLAGVDAWIAWTTFAFACGYVALAAVGSLCVPPDRPSTVTP